MPSIPLAGKATSYVSSQLRLRGSRLKRNNRKYFFTQRTVNLWNSLLGML
ncbi:hypothetical protein UY3_03553 [Chelonia mydas]|uniref:Uncharacterized protein n=1 Tax=Chelonia mydas TaxID=8469 RepID=M7C420_CHEMY|nr:hypothetical protein UY3_03553 [Chelonia mydas]